jgi:4-amino-4-deoxy-L-arabinose transferase-like glycosyltransferase
MRFCVTARACGLTAMAAVLGITLAMPAVAQHQDRGGVHRGNPPSAQWHGDQRSYGGYGGYGYHDNSGAIVGGALLGLGLGALLGGALVAPPPVVYAPPPVPYYYNNGPPPYYAYPYAPPPPVYYGR